MYMQSLKLWLNITKINVSNVCKILIADFNPSSKSSILKSEYTWNAHRSWRYLCILCNHKNKSALDKRKGLPTLLTSKKLHYAHHRYWEGSSLIKHKIISATLYVLSIWKAFEAFLFPDWIMDTNSGNWRCARKAHLLVTYALLLLQNFLIISEIFAEATSSVSPTLVCGSSLIYMSICE